MTSIFLFSVFDSMALSLILPPIFSISPILEPNTPKALPTSVPAELFANEGSIILVSVFTPPAKDPRNPEKPLKYVFFFI